MPTWPWTADLGTDRRVKRHPHQPVATETPGLRCHLLNEPAEGSGRDTRVTLRLRVLDSTNGVG